MPESGGESWSQVHGERRRLDVVFPLNLNRQLLVDCSQVSRREVSVGPPARIREMAAQEWDHPVAEGVRVEVVAHCIV